MSIELLVGLLTAAVALSGWGTLWYQHWIAKPKLGGSVIQIIQGQMTRTGPTPAQHTTFLGFVALTNLRPLPNQIIDFELRVKTQSGWHRLERVFQDPQGRPLAFQFGGGSVEISRAQFLNRPGQVQLGEPLAGFVLFFGSGELYHQEVSVYELTLVDVFGRKHVIETEPSEFRSPHLMAELSGIDFTAAITPPNATG